LRNNEIPNLKAYLCRVATETEGLIEGSFKIAICVRTQRVRAESRFKWKRALPAAPRVVEKESVI